MTALLGLRCSGCAPRAAVVGRAAVVVGRWRAGEPLATVAGGEAIQGEL
ncbi:MAG: hypothetical protein IT196_04545 [Acidimicrobiales bacterium]|nr:hypothetical protein [Acidimicrobiales bacterium]